MSEEVLEQQSYEFDGAFQQKIVSLFMRDTQFAMRTKDLIKAEYFTEAASGAVVNMVQEHLKTYKAAPDPRIIPTLLKDAFAAKRIRPDMKDDVVAVVKGALGKNVDLSNSNYVLDKVKDFARHQAVEQAIMASLPALEKKDWKSIEKLMKGALSVGASVDSQDYDYWKEIDSRTIRREDIKAGRLVKRGITTGYTGMDAYLFHAGWGRRELSCLMGAAKAGKSLGLGDFTKNASLAGFNAFYGSCEVASWIIAERIDAALSDTMIKDLAVDPATVKAKIQAMEAKSGAFKMRDFASGTLKPSQLHRIIEEYRNDGIIFDLITVDYADIMASEYRSDNLQENLRTIYIDLRAIAHEFDAALLTATQTNRDGAKAATAKATDVGDDWNKARTVDILIGINATDAEKAAGEARLYWALSRNTEDGFSLRIRQNRQKMQFLNKIIARE
ncbi:DnaB-like helicase C-terminal domain-containing protein [Shinella zoogloeoides]|uniref:DnaB-like helicase C-terminal domain-containing protein n=1 Tax=Shinella zoogloeoides TaxID=352475 RepID=UPI00273EB3C2|nr:DnaB-like helicase C-terminal domain-containing protein [Shinella zoogloeoides]WLR91027.1 DnaB-like helicase C-terminal domain-containing protein [Shinella zoogloeoides]